jgi:hypothetical protein
VDSKQNMFNVDETGIYWRLALVLEGTLMEILIEAFIGLWFRKYLGVKKLCYNQITCHLET